MDSEPVFIPRSDQVDFSKARWCPVVNCVVRYRDKFLLVKRNRKMRLYPEYWNGISGFLDDRKSLEEKVYEELNEETGLTKENIKSIKLCGIFDQEDLSIGKSWIVHAVAVTVDTNNLTFDWEAEDHNWVTKDEVVTYQLLPGFDQVLEAVISHGEE